MYMYSPSCVAYLFLCTFRPGRVVEVLSDLIHGQSAVEDEDWLKQRAHNR